MGMNHLSNVTAVEKPLYSEKKRVPAPLCKPQIPEKLVPAPVCTPQIPEKLVPTPLCSSQIPEKRVPAPLCPPHISHKLAWDRIWIFEVKEQHSIRQQYALSGVSIQTNIVQNSILVETSICNLMRLFITTCERKPSHYLKFEGCHYTRRANAPQVLTSLWRLVSTSILVES